MRVLFIATYAGTSGASHSLLTMVKLLRDKGIEPIILLPGHGPIEKLLIKNNIPYKIFRMFNWITEIEKRNILKERVKWLIKKLINYVQEIRIFFLIKREKIDLVHINAITAGWGFHAAKKNNKPVVWHIREFLEEDLNKTFWKEKDSVRCLNRADCVIAISDSVRQKYSQFIKNNNLIRIYNGIDNEQYNKVYNIPFTREEITLTLAGRIVSGKGHIEAINALKILVDEGITSIKLRFVGSEGDISYIKQVNKLIHDLSLVNYVEFMGYREDMHKVWGETDIALVCSKAEAFGRVTIEAMLAGALVIGANTKGTAELISENNGVLYEQGNYHSLAEKVKYVLKHKDAMLKVAIEGRKYSNENFTADINASNIYNIYKTFD